MVLSMIKISVYYVFKFEGDYDEKPYSYVYGHWNYFDLFGLPGRKRFSTPELNQNNQVTNALAKPSPYLIGTTNTPFHFPPRIDPESGLPIFWEGTIDFGEESYGLYFISHGEPRDFSQASPFYEEFVIHDLTDETIYMKGWNAGVVTYANKDPEPVKFHANGKIVEAYGPFKVGRIAIFTLRALYTGHLAKMDYQPDFPKRLRVHLESTDSDSGTIDSFLYVDENENRMAAE